MQEEIKKIISQSPVGAASGSQTDDLPVLTKSEEDDAIMKARIAKRGRLNLQAYTEKLRAAPAIWKPEPQEYINQLLVNHSWFNLDEQAQPVFELLSWYFTMDPRFEAAGYSQKKGIALVGGIGCGKTAMLRLFHFNPYASFTEVNCSAVSEQFARDGFEIISHYGKTLDTVRNGFGQDQRGMFFDDMGTEDERRNYGNTSNVMADIIMRRYSNGLPFQHTHVTSNLDEEGMNKMYGPRVTSRLFEMLNIIEFSPSAKDRRRQ